MTSITAIPIAQETGFPPNVLKNSMSPNEEAISGVVKTAAMGCPFPIGFPITTMSGVTPLSWKAHMLVPTLPNPTCTSSAISSPPLLLTAEATSEK